MAAEEGTTDSRPPRRTDLDAAERWRLDCFLKLGFLFDDAVTLARAKADHWVVERALKADCTHKQAIEIFS